jgi:shikimate kinase
MIDCQKCKTGKAVVTGTTATTTTFRCEACGSERNAARAPVFFVAGPSGCGKTTAMHLAMQQVQSVVHFDVDLLWGLSAKLQSPADNYAELSRTRLLFAWSLIQSGRPVVLWGGGTPEQTEVRPERRMFSSIHYLSLVCDEDVLLQRLKNRGEFNSYSDVFLAQTMDYARYLRDPARNKLSSVIDTTHLSPEATAEAVGRWIASASASVRQRDTG